MKAGFWQITHEYVLKRGQLIPLQRPFVRKPHLLCADAEITPACPSGIQATAVRARRPRLPQARRSQVYRSLFPRTLSLCQSKLEIAAPRSWAVPHLSETCRRPEQEVIVGLLAIERFLPCFVINKIADGLLNQLVDDSFPWPLEIRAGGTGLFARENKIIAIKTGLGR